MLRGALHLEDKLQLMMGKVLQTSCSDTVLAQADVLPSGCVQSAFTDNHNKHFKHIKYHSFFLSLQTTDKIH